MSAEHSQHAPVRLLIAESSENTAHEFDSLLRDAGIPTRMQLIDLPMAGEAVTGADLMLCNANLPQVEQLLPRLRTKAPHVPIILVNPPDHALSTSEGMRLGAADVVSCQDPDELVLVFKRELAHVCQGQRLSQLHKALEEAEQRCQLLLQSSTAAIAYVHEGMHIHANPGYLKLFGFSDPDELLGLGLMDLLEGDSADKLKQELKRFRLDGEERTLEFTGRASDGAEVRGAMTLASADYEGEPCMQVTVRPMPDPGGAGGIAGAGAQTANGNGSAAGVIHSVEDFVAGAHGILDSVQTHRAVLVAQVDAFSALQDEVGLRSAEAVGARVFAALEEGMEGRLSMRLGPHQYAFAVSESDRAPMLERAESLRKSVEGLMIDVGGRTLRTTVSVGGAELDEDESEPSAIFERALDAAFATARRAEEAGGNRVELLTKEVTREDPGSEAGQVLSRINDAIDKQRFLLLFQPIISLRGDSDEHYEVFLRMVDSDGRHVAPHEFLSTAIRHGVAAKIDRWVILQSIKMLSTHRSKGHNTRLTINLTANSVSDPDFLQWLGVAIKAARLPSDAVIFQITEEDAANQVQLTGEFVEGLKAMHCRASLSRFGLAPNAMDILQSLPVDFVKLDGSHIERLMEDGSLKEDITGMIKTLQESGKLTIIPMVESAGVLSALWQAGANYIQGHYLQEPSTEMNFDFSTDD